MENDKRKRNVIDDADNEEPASKRIKLDEDDIMTQLEAESKAVRVHPFDIPELAARILYFMLDFPSTIIKLAMSSMRYMKLVHSAHIWHIMGFTLMPSINGFIEQQTLRTVLANLHKNIIAHQIQILQKKLKKIKDFNFSESATSTIEKQLADQRCSQKTILEAVLTVGLTEDAMKALLRVKFNIAYDAFSLSDLISFLDVTKLELKNQSKAREVEEFNEAGVRKTLVAHYFGDYQNHGLYAIYKIIFSKYVIGQQRICYVWKKFLDQERSVVLVMSVLEKGNIKRHSIMFIKYNKEDNLIEECGNLRDYSDQYFPDAIGESGRTKMLRSLLELKLDLHEENWADKVLVDLGYPKELLFYYCSRLKKNTAENKFLVQNIKLRKEFNL